MARIPFVRRRTVPRIAHTFRSGRPLAGKARWRAIRPLARTDGNRTPAHVADLVGLSAVTVRAAAVR
jgi:hypothetical protein